MEWHSIVCIALGSSALFGFIQFLITRRDKKKDDSKVVIEKLNKLEKDICRTQLLELITDYGDNVSEIMKIARHYFEDLNGNWYLSSLFEEWLQKHKMSIPNWFEKK